MMPEAESALVILVPQAEPLVRSFRERYDPSSSDGMPAHITVLYPFRPPEGFDGSLFSTLRALFKRHRPFHYSLGEPKRFPDVLYLAPTPAEPFKMLTASVAKTFPDHPPYGGAFAEVVPHLTVAQILDAALLLEVDQEFRQTASGALPLHAEAKAVTLMAKSNGPWATVESFPLGSS